MDDFATRRQIVLPPHQEGKAKAKGAGKGPGLCNKEKGGSFACLDPDCKFVHKHPNSRGPNKFSAKVANQAAVYAEEGEEIVFQQSPAEEGEE